MFSLQKNFQGVIFSCIVFKVATQVKKEGGEHGLRCQCPGAWIICDILIDTLVCRWRLALSVTRNMNYL